MWILKFDSESVKVGFYRPDGRLYAPFTFALDEIYEATKLVNYLNGGSGDELKMKILMD